MGKTLRMGETVETLLPQPLHKVEIRKHADGTFRVVCYRWDWESEPYASGWSEVSGAGSIVDTHARARAIAHEWLRTHGSRAAFPE